MKILIVEDDIVSGKKLEKIFEGLGECEIVTNGMDAINSFTSSLERKEPYDLITMDIFMSDMDGHETTINIREIEKTRREMIDNEYRNVKILMISASGKSKNIISSLMKHGADGYIVKPFNKEKVLKELKKIGFNF